MRRFLFWKIFAILGLALLLFIPLLLIEGKVSERSGRQQAVEANIAESAAGAQQLVGPLLVVRYTETWTVEEKDEKTGRMTQREVSQERRQVIVPKELRIDGRARIEERYRGLYKAQLFHLSARLSGAFRIPKDFGIDREGRRISLGDAHVVLGISDQRGIQNRPVVQWDGKAFDFEAGTDRDVLGRSIQANLGRLDAPEAKDVAFELPLELLGSQNLSIAPVAEDTRVALASDWPSPSFGGRFLPVERKVDASGFEALWQVSHLARDLGQILEPAREGVSGEVFQVTFVDPVNIYLMSERAVKYGLLFIGLTFAAFFLFEVLKRLPIHPMQYLLVGLALAMFFLLLISLSEHLPFLWAYLVAGGSAVLLLGAYLAHVLGSRLRGFGFAAGLALLYAVLYGLLVSEDNALLMGSILLFCALGAIMLATRKLDWYGLGANRE